MTILGKHTVSELKDLVDSHQLLIDNLGAKRKGLTWSNNDSADWDLDYVRFLGRWSKASSDSKRVIVEATIANPFVGASLIPAEDTYQEVLHALSLTPGQWQKGDFQDLVNRLSEAGANLDSSVVQKFQEVAVNSSDLDLEGFKKADIATTIVKEAGAVVVRNLPWGKIVIGGAGAIGTLAILHKLKLL